MRHLLLGVLVGLVGCGTVDQFARDAVDTIGASRTYSATWDTDASALRGQSGRFAFTCPANPRGRDQYVWGSNPYTDDSSVCQAAVHAGAITYASGGRVVVETRPGQDRYTGSRRNGVETLDYGSWGDSFYVVVTR